jgi:hypothetical protein
MIYLLCWLISPVVGAIIGNALGRPGAGAIWGLLLGPLGWLLMVAVPHMRPKCPECGGVVVSGVRRCKNCGSELSAQKPESLETAPSFPRTQTPIAPSSNDEWNGALEEAQHRLTLAGLAVSEPSQVVTARKETHRNPQPLLAGVVWYHYLCVLMVGCAIGLWLISSKDRAFSSNTRQTSPESTFQSIATRLGDYISDSNVTLDQYNRMTTGMTYWEVRGIVRTSGVELSRSRIEGVPGIIESIETIAYSWSDPDGSNMLAMFQNDKLIQKSQFGLH